MNPEGFRTGSLKMKQGGLNVGSTSATLLRLFNVPVYFIYFAMGFPEFFRASEISRQ